MFGIKDYRSLRYITMSVTLGGILVSSRFIEPSSLPSICIFRMVTGIPCMFCGLTHAFHATSLGRFVEAAAYHPLVFPAYGLVVFHFAIGCLRLSGWEYPRFIPRLETSTMVKITFAVFTLFWMVRGLFHFI